MGIVVIGAVFVDIKGYPEAAFVPTGRNAGRVEQIHGGVARNVAEDIANAELRPTFVSLVDHSGTGADVIRKLKSHKVNTDYIRTTSDGMGTWLAEGMFVPPCLTGQTCIRLRRPWSAMEMKYSGMRTVSSSKSTWTRMW